MTMQVADRLCSLTLGNATGKTNQSLHTRASACQANYMW